MLSGLNWILAQILVERTKNVNPTATKTVVIHRVFTSAAIVPYGQKPVLSTLILLTIRTGGGYDGCYLDDREDIYTALR